MLKIIWN